MRKIFLCTVFLGGLLNCSLAEDMIPLALELPEAMFENIPKTLKSDNLETDVDIKARKPVMIPSDVQNMARETEVTSSDSEPIFDMMELVTDGDKEGFMGNYIELNAGKQYVQIDLGEPCDIFAVAVWHSHSEPRIYKDVIIQLAYDEEFTQDVHTIFNNDHDNSLGMGAGKDKEWIETNKGRAVKANGEKAQFVRLYSNGNNVDELNHYTEVEVYGR